MLATTFKKSAVALAFGLTSLAATSAFAADPIILPVTDGTIHFGNDFASGVSFTDIFQFTLTSPTDVSGTASSTYLSIGSLVYQGVDLTSVVLAGENASPTQLALDLGGATSTTETWTFSLANLSAGTYTLTISGVAGITSTEFAKASYGGNITFTAAVPEPSTYGMLALGLGLVGFAARSRKNASKFA
ncbi:FxDxF family PEP-CTERM protein [Methylobacillus sp. Pita2]|uniref:FxDxF family PEP-CTERM protein n=1 Tax=Methylobacillus TaxID=404 RepID=UPI0028540062|nr:FxDxF family PEP-CTERM protein [Methylobacillus flagellatus]MDR5171079.1 PEP-CTERM sorting domain-containing protein [Methylobacillus flagellatus]